MQRMADEEAGVGGPRGSALRSALRAAVGGGADGDEEGGENDDGDSMDGEKDEADLSEDESDDDGEGGGGGDGDGTSLPPALMAMAGLVNSTNAGLAGRDGAAGIGVDDDDDDDSEDEDDYLLRPEDTVLLACKSQEDYSSLEVHVYNPDDGVLFVHHDISMPTFPLCVEWLDFATTASVDPASLGGSGGGGAAAVTTGDHRTPGSFAAIGTFGQAIEIYDLDVLQVRVRRGRRCLGVNVREGSLFADLLLGADAATNGLARDCGVGDARTYHQHHRCCPCKPRSH